MVIFLSILQILISLGIIGTVLLQHGKTQGLSGNIAGGAETFFGKNKGRTIEGKLSKLTVGFSIAFVIMTVLLTFVVR